MVGQMKLVGFAALVAFLGACGGGSGGGSRGDDDKGVTYAFTDLTEKYENLRLESYRGAMGEAELTEAIAKEFAEIIALQHLNKDASGMQASARKASAASNNSESTLAKKSIGIDEKVNCDVGGFITMKGVVNDDYVGGIQVEYKNCDDGDGVLNGRGAVYFHDASENHVTQFFDQITLTTGVIVETYTGSIESFESFYDAETGRYVEKDVLNIYVDSVFGQYMHEDVINLTGKGYNPDITATGKVYLAPYGYVSVSTPEPHNELANKYFPTRGKVLFQGSSGSGYIEFENDYNRAYINLDASLAANFNYSPENGQIVFSDWVKPDQLGLPLRIDIVSFKNSNVNTTSTISLYEPVVENADSNTDLSYYWFVNGGSPIVTSEPFLEPGKVQKGDRLFVRAKAQNNYYSVFSDSSTLVVADAPAEVTLKGLPDTLKIGDTLSASIQYFDPDSADPQTPGSRYVLNYGPPGMTLTDEGKLSWTSSDLMFGVAQEYEFSITLEGETSIQLNHSLVVQDENPKLPLVHSNIQAASSYNAMSVVDCTGDNENEILIGTNNDLVMTLSLNNNSYQQSWVYPFAFGDSEGLVTVLPVDQNKDNVFEPLAITTNGIYWIENLSMQATLQYTPPDNQYIIAAAVANLDNDENLEVAVLLADLYYGRMNHDKANNLTIVDLGSGEAQWSVELASEAESVLIGNVDQDISLEIVLNNGSIYDATTTLNQWYYAQEFGSHLVLGDLDYDGVDEIIGGSNLEAFTVFDAVQKTTLWSRENVDTCGLDAANIDEDPQDELLVVDCQSGDIKAYDASSGAPIEQWSIDSSVYKRVNVITGDTDNDGNANVVWESRDFYSGDILAVADISELPSSVLYSEPPFQITNFIAAGWGQIAPDDFRSVFISSDSFGFDKQRILTLDLDGELTIIDEMNSRGFSDNRAKLVDYDKDGYVELMFSPVVLNIKSFQVRNLFDNSVKWTDSSGESSRVGAITSADINDDGFDDAIYVRDFRVKVVDIINQISIWNSSDLGTIYDVTEVKLNEGGIALAIATSSKVSIWRWNGVTFLPGSEYAQTCRELIAVNVDGSGDEEILCTNSYYSSDESELLVLDTKGQLKYEVALPGLIGAISSTDVGEDSGSVLVGLSKRANGRNRQITSTKIAMVNLSKGTIIWTSPPFPGKMTSKSLHYFEAADGKPRLTFATDQAMFVTQ